MGIPGTESAAKAKGSLKTSGSLLTDSFSTSGYMTSGGSYLPDATPPTTYDFSGTYKDPDKEFNWFKDSTTPTQ